MAIILAYEGISEEQKRSIRKKMEDFAGEVNQLSLFPDCAQVVLNDAEISAGRGQKVLDILVEMLHPHSWGTDLPIRFPERNQPPKRYASRYNFSIPYDANLS